MTAPNAPPSLHPELHRTIVDQMGRSVRLPRWPQRIVSLVPSQTELLFDLGAADRVVGVTRYCVHPATALRQAADVGGTKRFDFDRIEALKPDLIIGNKEENYPAGIDRLAASFPVWMSDIATLDDATGMISQLGDLLGESAAANSMVNRINQRWQDLPGAAGQTAIYLIWKKPWMAVGAGTFIHDVLRQLDLRNLMASQSRYPELSMAELKRHRPQLLLLSSEPFPFAGEHVAQLQAELPGTRVLLVDGEMFSWYGSRLLLAPDYFTHLLSQDWPAPQDCS